MNLMEALQDYLAPVMGDALACLGQWSEERGEESNEYLSINLHPGAKPGVISKTRHIELWYVSPVEGSDRSMGKVDAFNRANEFLEYIESTHSSSCFSNVIPIAGIIGPKETERQRMVYLIPIEITY